MKIVELVFALVLLVSAALGLVEALGFPRDSVYLPAAVLALTCALSLAWAAQSVLALRREPPTLRIDRAEARRLVTLAALSLVYALAIETIGFFTSSALFIPGAAVALGYRSARGIALCTVAFILLLYAVFGMLLKTPLPPELILEVAGA
jgi:hypothetical protein